MQTFCGWSGAWFSDWMQGAQVGIPRGKKPEKTTAVQKCANLVGFENDAF